MRRTILSVPLALALAAVSRPAAAETTRYVTLEGLGHFLDGDPESTAVGEDGSVTLPPASHTRWTDAGQTFSAATTWGDEVVVARVDDGQVLAVDRAGHTRPLWRSQDAMVTAMVVADGALYVASGPPAKVTRIAPRGGARDGADHEARPFAAPAANFVWDLVAGRDGELLAATGEPGGVVALDRRGRAEVRFAPEQAHVRALLYHPELGCFAGGGERGVVYRQAPGGAFVAMFDSGFTEITAMVVDRDAVVVAAVSGAAALVADEGNKRDAGKATDVRSQVVRLAMDGAGESIAASTDEAIFALAPDGQGRILAATGGGGRDAPHGRIYRLDPGHHGIAMAHQSPSRRLTHLLRLPDGMLAAVGAAGGRILDLGPGLAREGRFVAQQFDAGVHARFGLVELAAALPDGTAVTAQLRSGQTGTPDATWSPWSAPVASPGGHGAQVAPGRYLQVRLDLRGDGRSRAPEVHRVRVAFLRQNLPPVVRDVAALRRGWALAPLPRDEAKGKIVADRPEDGRADEVPRRATPARARQVPDRGALAVRWVAEDPNGDELSYTLWARAAGAVGWTLLADRLDEPFATLRAGSFADGRYQFRVRASDAPSNPAGSERDDCRESRWVVVDQSPPEFGPLSARASGGRVRVTGHVADRVGPLVELTVAVDAGPPRPLAPRDGLLDGPEEDFVVALDDLAPGPHTVVVRAVDEGDNAAAASAAVTVAGS